MGFFDFFRRKKKPGPPPPTLKEVWQGFQEVLAHHNETLVVLGDLEEKGAAPQGIEFAWLSANLARLDEHVSGLLQGLKQMSGDRWRELEAAHQRLKDAVMYRLSAAANTGATADWEELRDLILPLHMVDRRNPDFRPENCRTYQDIIRFAHERAMQSMFGLMDAVEQGRVKALRLLKLKTDLPLNLHLVDLGDGLASHQSPVPPEDILSVPMKALWQGISHPAIAWSGPVPVSVSGFLHVLGQTAIRPPERFWDKTYAIVAAQYVNYACRLGFHFQSIDSYCGPDDEDNYINFTFKGGAADDLRRIRRIRLIVHVLERLGFEVETHLDVARARFRKQPAAATQERLDLVGRLMAYVRQMDMLMNDDDIPYILAERFLAGHYERPGVAASP
jgi:pyruvate,water dikinase